MGVDLFPGIEKPTSRDRLGAELADEQLKLIFGMRDIRVGKGLTISEVATAMRVDPSLVSRFESGSTNPTMSTIRRYAKAVGAAFRIETRSWASEQTRMVKSSVDTWTRSGLDSSEHAGDGSATWGVTLAHPATTVR
ncbi:helix-turn-helix domain-containing protein [Tsukamurella soli]|uniref:HTH cro/C1-type domain-containing protein n=1 Tax=Tsukamurella soli TaxID=644556 RepID=A0ABP8KBH9_9ACTN